MPHRPRPRRSKAATPISSSRATRCALRLRPSAAGSTSTRAPRKVTKDARGRKVFQDLALEEKEHLGKLEARYAELLRRDPQLESRPTFLFFKGAANGLFAEGAERLMRGVNDQQALMIGIRCERGSHRFFKKYGERFEDSEGKQIFLEFADEEREHLDLLIREYRALVKRQGRPPPRRPLVLGRHRARERTVVDRSSPPHDRVRRPLQSARARRAGGCRRGHRDGRHRSRHDRVGGRRARAGRRNEASRRFRESRSPRSKTVVTSTCSATS